MNRAIGIFGTLLCIGSLPFTIMFLSDLLIGEKAIAGVAPTELSVIVAATAFFLGLTLFGGYLAYRFLVRKPSRGAKD